MHRSVLIGFVAALAACLLLSLPFGAQAQQGEGGGAMSFMDKVSYSIGYDLGRDVLAGLERDEVNANLDVLIGGFADALKDADPSISQIEMERVLIAFQDRVSKRSAADRMQSDPVYKAMADENARRGEAFRTRFAAREDTTSLGDGIHYKVVSEGDGGSPARSDTVVVNYQGLLITGEEFQRGRMAAVEIDSLLPGAQKVLTSMEVGDRWYVVIPPDQAFGEAGRPPEIGPNETLVFDVELVEIR